MTGRDHMFVAVLTACALLAGLWFGLVGPRRAEVSRLNEQVVAAQDAADAAVAQLNAGRAAEQRYAQEMARIARLGKAVPERDDQASLLYQLQDAAGRSRVHLTSVAPGGTGTDATAGVPAAGDTPAAAVQGVESVPISLAFEGTYRDLERFLRRIHRFARIGARSVAVHGRLIAVESLALSTGGPESTPLKATIQARTFLAAAPVAATPPNGAAPGSGDVATAPGPQTPPAMIGAGG